VICWKGKVLAGISIEAVEVEHEHGPATVVRLIDHPEMASAAEHVVKHLGLSGFVGFDFVLDEANRAWILEMNPRVTPICHFSPINGTNLALSLYTHMTGRPPAARPTSRHAGLAFDPTVNNHDPVALFPSEIVRCPSSEYVQSGQHDVPWNEPELVLSVLNQALRTGIRRRVRIFLERSFPTFVDALVRLRVVDPRRGIGER
jgi:hypothetical protein